MRSLLRRSIAAASLLSALVSSVHAFVPPQRASTAFGSVSGPLSLSPKPSSSSSLQDNVGSGDGADGSKNAATSTNTEFPSKALSKAFIAVGASFAIASSSMFGYDTGAYGGNYMIPPSANAVTEMTTTEKKYDGFAEYAKENQMEQSDVGCFVSKCGEQTKQLFSSPRGIKGVSCLGRCKGEQSCATRCFAEFGSDSLNDWLSCTIEENECVKVPKNVDNSAEDIGYSTAVRNFDPSSLVGSWYKTDGLNPNYDLFDCQTNTFAKTNDRELDMGIFFRVRRPEEAGGGFWENSLTEHMVVDAARSSSTSSGTALTEVANAATEDNSGLDPAGRTMHTSGKMYGLEFSENWYIVGESDGKKDIAPFKLVAYKGHTLQGNYEGAFVYAKQPELPDSARAAVREAAARAGLDFDQFTKIDNTCPAGDALNDSKAGTGTSTTDWIDLVIGEGGVIDWISPGWRGEYKR